MAIDTPIPEDKHYLIGQACYSIAMNVRDELETTTNHASRVAMANDLISSPGNKALKYAQIAEAYTWPTGVDWTTITDADLKTAISAVWDHIALASFNSEPVA